MKKAIFLTILQALGIYAAPSRHKRQYPCEFQVTETAVVTVTIDAHTSSTVSGGIFLQSPSTSSVTPSVSVMVMSTSSEVIQILPTLSSTASQVTVSVPTTLQTLGITTGVPIISTSIPAPTSLIAITATSTLTPATISFLMASSDIFQPIATGAPPSAIGSRSDHPVARLDIVSQDSALSTNKFYANFFLGSQTAPSFTHPYSLAWAKGSGSSSSWGIAVSHIEASQRVYGPTNTVGAASYFINPIGIQSLVLSALELGNDTTLSIDTLTAFSTNISLLASPGGTPVISFPLVQGMGFVTGKYNGGTPIVQTGVFFRTVTQSQISPKTGVTKYTLLLEDGNTWLLYAYSSNGAVLEFTVVNNGLLQATSNFIGIIQLAKNPGNAESLYDAACGAYATSVNLSGTVSEAVGSYTFNFEKSGISNTTLVMFALPHHVQSFSSVTSAALTSVQLQTTTKGNATAIVADSWTLVEPDMPISMGFAPWSPSLGSKSTLSAGAIAAIQSVALSEISQNISTQTDLDSFYYSGKVSSVLA